MNKPVYLGFSILGITKTRMYEFWYEYLKPKYIENIRLCYMDTDSFIFHVKTEDFYEDIADNVEKWFDTSNCECDRPFLQGKNKKQIGKIKDELGGWIRTKFASPRAKFYSYLMDDDSEAKKEKGSKKCVIKRMLKFNDYKNCALNNKVVLKSQQRFKSERHIVYTAEINKIALRSNDDKRFQTCDRITSISFDNYTNENKTEHNSKYPYIPDHPYRILNVGSSESGKTNAL